MTASTATTTSRINAPVDVLYDMITDVARMGEWSPECVGAEVPANGPIAPSVTFTGSNRRGDQEWTTRCEVIAAERPHLFSFKAGDDDTPTTWTYELRAVDPATTDVTESCDISAMRDPDVAEQLSDRRDQLAEDMAATLAALKTVAERDLDR